MCNKWRDKPEQDGLNRKQGTHWIIYFLSIGARNTRQLQWKCDFNYIIDSAADIHLHIYLFIEIKWQHTDIDNKILK